jgi:predicted acyl esterase
MCIWEGAADWYRDMTHHGGILSTFWENWYDMQVKTVQYGAGERGKRSRVHGELVCGPDTLSEDELAKNRAKIENRVGMGNQREQHRHLYHEFRRSCIIGYISVQIILFRTMRPAAVRPASRP